MNKSYFAKKIIAKDQLRFKMISAICSESKIRLKIKIFEKKRKFFYYRFKD